MTVSTFPPPPKVRESRFDDWMWRFHKFVDAPPGSSSPLATPYFKVETYGAIGDGVTDDTLALIACSNAVVAAGGGTVFFGAGKTYKVWTSATGTLFSLNGANGVTVMGNGATIVSGQVNTAGPCKVFDIHGVNGFSVDSLTFLGGNTTLTSSTGEYFLQGYNGTHNVCVSNCVIKDCLHGVMTDSGGTSVCRGWTILNVYMEKVYYGLACYWLDDVFARGFVTRNCGRAYFPVNPCNNHDIDLDSQQGNAFSDCLIKVYARNTYSVAENTVSNIRLNYRSTGRYASSGDSDNEEGCVAFDLQQYDTNTAAGHFHNIKINFDVACNATDQFANLLILRKYKSTGAGDNTTTRGHSVRDLTISGTALDWNNATQNGIRLFSTTTFTTAQDWTGDTIENISVRDFRMTGSPPTDALYVNGQGFSDSTQSLVIDNVNLAGAVTYANVTAGRIAKRAFIASNENNSDCEGAWTPSLGGTATYTVQTGKWIKRGGKVKAWGRLTVNAIGTGSTYAISGLPFTAGADYSGSVSYFASAAINVVHVTCYVNSGSTSVTFGVLTAASTGITTSPNFFGAGTDALFEVEYFV